MTPSSPASVRIHEAVCRTDGSGAVVRGAAIDRHETMKYFTPDRYLRLGNLEDESAFLAAHEEWERAMSEYRDHLQKIRARLPAGMRRLVESVYLHDARVVDMVLGTRNRFVITLQPESLPTHRIVLAYSLLGRPTIHRQALPESARSEPLEWLYDELDIGGKKPVTFRHDILLSNGWELKLRFRTVSVTRPQPMIDVAHQFVQGVSGAGTTQRIWRPAVQPF
jgi:hypothetical protein